MYTIDKDMFNDQIDVAQIMQIIKANVIGNEEESSSGEWDRISAFINNTRSENQEYLEVGNHLPLAEKYPKIWGKIYRFIAKVIRKLSRFILRDQTIVNHNTDACLKALMEREDILYMQVLNLQKELNEIHKQKEETIEKKKEPFFSQQTYVDFENCFRGSKDDITKRYLFYWENYIKPIPKIESALDIGCGRGEWLKLLQDHDIKALGIDVNEAMVKECTEAQLDVLQGDAIQKLKCMDDVSFNLVTAFQVIEHITNDKVAELLVEIFRVLKEEGIMILETPNIQNLEVGASAFHLDPTHINPLYPDLLKFMSEKIGFSDVSIVRYGDIESNKWIEEITKGDKILEESTTLRTILETLKEKLYCAPDYAIVARKL